MPSIFTPTEHVKFVAQHPLQAFSIYCIPRWLYNLPYRLKHRDYYRAVKAHEKLKPTVGYHCYYHGSGPHLVVSVDGDELTLVDEDGGGKPFRASWQNCCEPFPWSTEYSYKGEDEH